MQPHHPSGRVRPRRIHCQASSILFRNHALLQYSFCGVTIAFEYGEEPLIPRRMSIVYFFRGPLQFTLTEASFAGLNCPTDGDRVTPNCFVLSFDADGRRGTALRARQRHTPERNETTVETPVRHWRCNDFISGTGHYRSPAARLPCNTSRKNRRRDDGPDKPTACGVVRR